MMDQAGINRIVVSPEPKTSYAIFTPSRSTKPSWSGVRARMIVPRSCVLFLLALFQRDQPVVDHRQQLRMLLGDAAQAVEDDAFVEGRHQSDHRRDGETLGVEAVLLHRGTKRLGDS